MTASVLCNTECILGEGPIWLPATGKLMWVDIEGKTLYEYDWHSRTTACWQMNNRVTLIVPLHQSNSLLLGMQGGLATFNPVSGCLQWLTDLEKEQALHRCNDGAADAQGRLWVGTLHMQFKEGAGSLYMLDGHLQLRRQLPEQTIPNGLVWSLDNSRMYFIDSTKRCVRSFLFDVESGGITFEKIAFKIPSVMGSPDGMTIDGEGMLWVAHYGGFGVCRWNPLTGALLEKIGLPAPNVTSCVFGGENMDTLFITTARQEMTEEALRLYPLSGSLFQVRTGVKGLPTAAFHLQAAAAGEPAYVEKQAVRNGAIT
ncbi:SMP-30/gluconolactonase/LRE family protein [Chitinophaga alhagiae]|uniref:SMP-30/gluconolactonase/LRE family protein n=1 Tax=Chitinophaga alhagiae TaxID=2203219 RepID=UPI000E5A2CAB|nr:SMP-30/gluconolactonase/LRE family protein [Chitinophaga alhagiae]